MDAIGAILVASVLVVSRTEAADRTEADWASDKDNPTRYETAAVKAMMRDKKRGLWGGAILCFGFCLQIFGVWYSWFSWGELA